MKYSVAKSLKILKLKYFPKKPKQNTKYGAFAKINLLLGFVQHLSGVKTVCSTFRTNTFPHKSDLSHDNVLFILNYAGNCSL